MTKETVEETKATLDSIDKPSSGKVTVEFVEAPYLIDYRVIERKDWKAMGIDHGKMTWSRENNYRLDISDASAGVKEYFLSVPTEFKVTEE